MSDRLRFPRHTPVVENDWDIDPAFLLRVKRAISDNHHGYAQTMEEIEQVLLALEHIQSSEFVVNGG